MRPILPGRPHSGRQAISTAYWNGIRVTAYVSCSAIVITTSLYSILQTIHLDCEPLQAVAIEEFSGRIAASNSTTVYIFEPLGEGKLKWEALGPKQGVLTSALALSTTNGSTNETEPSVNGIDSDPDLRRASIPTIATISSISWASAEELLVGGSRLQLWHIAYGSRVIWDQELSHSVAMAYCSHDAGLIASCGQHDRLVKIWRRLSYESDGTRFDVSYLRHASAVTNLHWRKPWHQEQNMDSLLYTFCTDGFVRAWAYTDPHSTSVMQKVASIDTRATIQPRRLSIGSISPRRYAFIIDSRDFSHATERAVENATNAKLDHALEHLIAIANRSPEICIILDGLGHMSAWGLENAGCKNKLPAEVFNVAHVDDVDLSLLQRAHLDGEHVQFSTFAGGSSPTSVSLLVHSFDGTISHFEAHIAGLFDTASRRERLQQTAAWAGHELPVRGIIRNKVGDQLLTWTEQDANIFSVEEIRDGHELGVQTSRSFDSDIIDAIFVEDYAVVLLEESLQLLPTRESIHLNQSRTPTRLRQLDSGNSPQQGHFAIEYSDRNIQVWLPQPPSRTKDDSPAFAPAAVDQNGHDYLFALYSSSNENNQLPWRSILAASRSSMQDILTNLTLLHHSPVGTLISWPVARATCLPLWLSAADTSSSSDNTVSLSHLFALIARTIYTTQADHPRSPVPCSLYYIALHQKPLLLSLWRTAHGITQRDATLKLLSRNFDEPRWREAALKNAYALLSKRRFEYAAAWFLLAGKLRDAVVGVLAASSKVNDWVLGIGVARVWMCAGEKQKEEGARVIRDVLAGVEVQSEIEKLEETDQADEAKALRQWKQEMLDSLGSIGDESDAEDQKPAEKTKGRNRAPSAPRLAHRRKSSQQTKTKAAVAKEPPSMLDDFTKPSTPSMLEEFTQPSAPSMLDESTQPSAPSMLDAFTEEPGSVGKAAGRGKKDVKHDDKSPEEEKEDDEAKKKKQKKAPTQFQEPSADSLLDSFGF